MDLRRLLLLIVAGSFLASAAVRAQQVPDAELGIFLPFHADEAWYVCRGYQIASHLGTWALDLTIDPEGFMGKGCYRYEGPPPSPSSEGRDILAPAAGTIQHLLRDDMIYLKLEDGGCLVIGHMYGWSRPADGSEVEALERIGVVAEESPANGDYAHIHIEARTDDGCAPGTGVPFEGRFRFFGVPDLPDRTHPDRPEVLDSQYHRTGFLSQIVESGEDDAGGHHASCLDSVDHPEVYLGTCDGSGEPMVSGLRFEDLPLAREDYVSAAGLVVQVDGPGAACFDVDVRVENNTHALPFALGDMPADRRLMSPRVLWALARNEDHWDLPETRTSPDLRSLIQALVQRRDWLKEDNAIALILASRQNPPGSRRFMAFERPGGPIFGPARLVVTRFGENPPIADAGPDQVMHWIPTRVTLDGSGSRDPDGDGLTYEWRQTSGYPLPILSSSGPRIVVNVPPWVMEDLEFELTVTDDSRAELQDTDRVRLVCAICGPQ